MVLCRESFTVTVDLSSLDRPEEPGGEYIGAREALYDYDGDDEGDLRVARQ